jgi:hypothetical protein
MRNARSAPPWAIDLLACLATAGLLWVGPLLDALLHPESPLWFPYATLPDAMVYVAMFHRAGAGSMAGDPFLWEHRVDPSSVFTVFGYWPGLFGILVRLGGEVMLPVTGWLLSALWFFGLLRLCRGLGQERRWAFFAAGLACFASVNLAYNLNGFGPRPSVWNFALTEHLRPYPSASSMATYALAAAALQAALARPGTARALLAGALMGLVALGRPFDWMVLMTASALLAAAFGWQRKRHEAVACLLALGVAALVAAPVLGRVALFQAAHAAAYQDQMWRGVFQAKAPLHYAKYTAALLAATALLLGAYRWALGHWRIRSWPVEAVFPLVLVPASLLPHYRTLLGGVTITGFSYFFVFSFSTWATIAALQALWLRRARVGPARGVGIGWPMAVVALVLAQQLALGLGQRERQAANVIPPDLSRLYREIAAGTPPDTVILGFRSGVELVARTGRWSFSPSPHVAALLTSASTEELLERALWSEFLLAGTLEPLAPLFDPAGIPRYRQWLAGQTGAARRAAERLEKRLAANSFIFHPRLSRYDLAARSLQLPPSLAGGDDFVAWFRPGLREVYARVVAASAAGDPLARVPFRVDAVLVTPDFAAQGGQDPARLGMVRAFHSGGSELWVAPARKPGPAS